MRLPGIEDLVVVELAEGIAGPFCGMLLADLGARVVKIEPPQGDWARTTGPPFVDGRSPVYLLTNRGKESVSLDLRDPRSVEAAHRLVERADVFVAGYRPGAADRLGLGADALLARNERLVYCVISGYGNRGPKREHPGSDTIMQGYAGIMSVTGEPDGPPARVGTALADTAAGVYAALGVVTMLLRREQTGRGGVCDTSLLEALIHLQTVSFATYFGGGTPRRLGSRAGLAAVPAQAFRTADGYLNLSCHSTRQWRRLCRALGHPEWEAGPGIATNEERVRNHTDVVRLIEGVLSGRTSADWMEVFEREGVNAGVINDYDDIVEDPQIAALGILDAVGSLRQVGLPITYDLRREPIDATEAPALGEHTRSVLAELGLEAGGIEAMLRSGAAVAAAAGAPSP
jgi:crotonobetainyl-CoA:carnitine CoA-transferase CaiB-like acyl-CoA transferase